MRLIDADKLMESLNPKESVWVGLVLSELIDNAPTVQAIPIEWILKRAKLCTADYANCLHYAVEAWQNEQKYIVNGQWKFPKE